MSNDTKVHLNLIVVFPTQKPNQIFKFQIFRSANKRSQVWDLKDDFADVVISCRDFELKGHKIILAAVSPVLRKELKTKNVLNWPDMNSKELTLILEFFYKGEVRVEKEQLSRFLEIANRLLIDLGNLTGNKNNSIANQKSDLKRKAVSGKNQVSEPPIKKRRIVEASNILFLPTEILTKILSYLSTYDLLQNVALTSRFFSQLSKSPKVHLNVSFSVLSDETGAIDFLRKVILIEELQIKPVKFWQWKPDRKKISNYKSLLETISKFPHLKAIKTFSRVSLDAFVSFKDSKWWNKLTKIQMYLDYQDKDPSLIREFDLAIKNIGSKSKMKKFQLFGKDLHFESKHYASVVKNNVDTLEEVFMNANSKEEYDKITTDLAQCPNLKSLIINNLFSIDCILQMKNLTTLTLNYNKTSQSDMIESISRMKLPNLTILRIGGFVHPGDGTDKIALAFAESCPNLTFFLISQVSLDFPTNCLLEIASRCKHLETFKFKTIPRSHVSIDQVSINTWQQFSKLKHLSIMGWILTDSRIRQIFKVCPKMLGLQHNHDVFLRSNKSIEEIGCVPMHGFWVPSFKNKIEIV